MQGEIEDEGGVQHGIEEEGGVQVGIHSSLSVSPNPTPPAPSLHLQSNPPFLFPSSTLQVSQKEDLTCKKCVKSKGIKSGWEGLGVV